MKKIFTLAGLLLVIVAKAQVGIGTPNPKDEAILEILSDNKGVLIPRIGIASNITKLSSSTTHEESLLIYNTITSEGSVPDENKVTPGFYYWKANKWNRIINESDLQAALDGNSSNQTKIDKIIALLNAAYNSNNLGDANGANNATQGGIIFNAGTGTPGESGYVAPTFSVLHANGSGGYTNTTITPEQLSEIFVGANVLTTLVRSEDINDLETREIKYTYKNENGNEVLINITQDVINSVGNNKLLKAQIVKVLDESGNVYFTATEIAAEGSQLFIPANSFYKQDPLTLIKTKITVPIDLEQFIAALAGATPEQKQIIRNHLGSNFSTVVNTGDKWSDDKYIYKGIFPAYILPKSANVVKSSSDRDFTEITLTSTGITEIGNVIKITVLDANGNQLTSAITDVEKSNTGVKFRIGTGIMYNILFPNTTSATQVNLLVEFSAS